MIVYILTQLQHFARYQQTRCAHIVACHMSEKGPRCFRRGKSNLNNKNLYKNSSCDEPISWESNKVNPEPAVHSPNVTLSVTVSSMCHAVTFVL